MELEKWMKSDLRDIKSPQDLLEMALCLEQSMALFEEGAKLLRECTKQLDGAEQKVTLLTAGEDGAPQEQPFQEGA